MAYKIHSDGTSVKLYEHDELLHTFTVPVSFTRSGDDFTLIDDEYSISIDSRLISDVDNALERDITFEKELTEALTGTPYGNGRSSVIASAVVDLSVADQEVELNYAAGIDGKNFFPLGYVIEAENGEQTFTSNEGDNYGLYFNEYDFSEFAQNHNFDNDGVAFGGQSIVADFGTFGGNSDSWNAIKVRSVSTKWVFTSGNPVSTTPFNVVVKIIGIKIGAAVGEDGNPIPTQPFFPVVLKSDTIEDTNLTTALALVFNTNDNPQLLYIKKISFPNLQTITVDDPEWDNFGGIDIALNGTGKTNEINFNSLETMPDSWFAIEADNASQEVTINIAKLKVCAGFYLHWGVGLTSLDLSGMIQEDGIVGGFNIQCPGLTTVIVPEVFNAAQNKQYDFSNCALNKATLMAMADALIAGGQTGGTWNISGGDNFWDSELDVKIQTLRNDQSFTVYDND